MGECHGCISIKEERFPFFKEEDNVFIDQEGCGVDGEDGLEINFCPVCGTGIEI